MNKIKLIDYTAKAATMNQSEDRGFESDTGEPYSSMYYKGKTIPSKTFMRLQQNVRRKPPRGKLLQ